MEVGGESDADELAADADGPVNRKLSCCCPVSTYYGQEYYHVRVCQNVSHVLVRDRIPVHLYGDL